MRLFFSYIKLHYKSLIIFFLFSAVFSGVFALYSIPQEAVLYALFICAFIGFVILIVSFFLFSKRHKMLLKMQQSVKISLDELPEPKNIIEEDYNEIIKTAFSEKCRAQSEQASSASEMTDYYTLWAHQIKTPIAAMRLLLQSSEENDENSELDNQLFLIEQYVDMVLNYIKSDYNANDFVIKRYDLDEIIRGAARKYANLFIRKKLTLDFVPTEMTVLTDEKWLSFVIEQLLSNAIKYTNTGKVSVYCKNGSELIIEDTGIGIAAEDLPRVCEKGYTGYNGRADKKSTGIGLYLCNRVLNKLSHRLIIQSEAGKGTKAIIEFSQSNMRFE